MNALAAVTGTETEKEIAKEIRGHLEMRRSHVDEADLGAAAGDVTGTGVETARGEREAGAGVAVRTPSVRETQGEREADRETQIESVDGRDHEAETRIESIGRTEILVERGTRRKNLGRAEENRRQEKLDLCRLRGFTRVLYCTKRSGTLRSGKERISNISNEWAAARFTHQVCCCMGLRRDILIKHALNMNIGPLFLERSKVVVQIAINIEVRQT